MGRVCTFRECQDEVQTTKRLTTCWHVLPGFGSQTINRTDAPFGNVVFQSQVTIPFLSVDQIPEPYLRPRHFRMESKQPTYENVSLSDDHEETMSNTEVDESLMGDEKEWHTSGMQWRSRRRTITVLLDSYRWHIDAFLLFVITVLAALLLLQARRRDEPSTRWQVGGDYTGNAPKRSLLLIPPLLRQRRQLTQSSQHQGREIRG